MDDCVGCRVFIGPTDGSVFVRDSRDCSLAVVCRQLRTRDCNNCKFSLYCRTRPIVESSTEVGFGCLDMHYPALGEQMRAAKLSPFHNFFWHVYDFTPKPGNWHLLPPTTTTARLLGSIPAEAAEHMGTTQDQGEAPYPVPVLRTHGDGKPDTLPDGRYLFVLFDGSKHEQALTLAREVAAKGWLLRTNEAKLAAPAATGLVAEAGWPKAAAKSLSASTAACVGMELWAPGGEVGALEQSAKQLGGLCSDSEQPGQTFRCMGVDG